LGQANSTKRQSVPKGRSWDVGTPEDESAEDEDSGIEEDGSNKEMSPLDDKEIVEPAFHDKVAPLTVGAALKRPDDTLFNQSSRPRKRRKADKASWRERLEEARGKPAEDASDDRSDSSDSISSMSDESEYSDWGGITNNDQPDGVLEDRHVSQLRNDDSESESSNSEVESESETEGSSSAEDDSQDNAEQIRQQAKGFTIWARQQSGFGETISNINSLPQLTDEQKKAISAARESEAISLVPQQEPTEVQQVCQF
jgi:hypothetical protein